MEMMVRNGFNIETLYEGQALSGYTSTAQTYIMNVKDRGTIVGTVADVREVTTPVTDDPNGPTKTTGYEVVFSPVWTRYGPRDETLLLNIDDIESATQAYIRCNVFNPKVDKDAEKDSHRLPGQRDCFVFRFKRKDLVLTSTNFCKILYHEKPEAVSKRDEDDDGRRAVFGYIQSINKVAGKSVITMKVLNSYCGLFSFSEMTIGIDQVYSVFQCRVDISEFMSRDKLKEKQQELRNTESDDCNTDEE